MNQFRESLANSPNFLSRNNLFYQQGLARNSEFESHYRQLREKERRLYPDELAQHLPIVPTDHPLSAEWMIRKRSLKILLHYLASRKHLNRILEIGCGNGWLAHHLAAELPVEVCALDINETELEQAAKLFKNPRLSFVYANLWDVKMPLAGFDVVILASSIQYFPDLDLLMDRVRQLCSPRGELHIFDSPFYSSDRASKGARKRSRDYFYSLGSEEMANHYFHHNFEKLIRFKPRMLHQPGSFGSLFQKYILRIPVSPFPWIRIGFE